MPPAKVKLADLIDHVAQELAEAERRAAAREKRVMRFKEAQLELAVSVETEGGGGLKVWVIELGGGRTKTDSNTITVTLSALPDEIDAIDFEFGEEGEGPDLGPGTAGD